ncbi:MAG: hypothetical protein JWP65_2826 [Ramlibacter sp.]|nr:hypothetical protein [Ramlibacter sp.]
MTESGPVRKFHGAQAKPGRALSLIGAMLGQAIFASIGFLTTRFGETMITHLKKLALALASASAVLMAGCGGGGGGAPQVTTATLSGVAATGAPFAGALVTAYDASGSALATTTTSITGRYTLDINSDAKAPLVVEAVRGDTTLVSAFAETRSTRLNITSLTNLVAALLASDGNPLSLRLDSRAVTTSNLEQRVADVVRILQPLRQGLADTINPLTGEFDANGSGHDRLLDAVQVDIRPAGETSNIELTVRVASAEPVKTSFGSDAQRPPALPRAIDTAKLPPVGIANMLDDMATRLTACFAVPFKDRVRGVSGGDSAVVGGADDVLAAACRTLFLGDDPGSFLSNGYRVGRNAANQGAFAGLFRAGATGAGFDQPQLQLLRENGDVVFSYRLTDSQGNISNDTLIAREVRGKLKLVGNRYAYEATVRPYAQDREFLNQPKANFISTGYDVYIANRLDSKGVPVFAKVQVTTPDGTVLVYRPTAGRAALVIERSDGRLTGTSVIRLAGKFKDAGTQASENLVQREVNLFFVQPLYSERQIVGLAEQGLWRLEFFHADAGKANVVQALRTLARAATLDELAATPIVQLTDAAKSELRAQTHALGAAFFGPVSANNPNVADLSAAGDKDFWTVPKGAQAPTSVTVFGTGPDPDGSGAQRPVAYDDAWGVSAAMRKVVVRCSKASDADNHCDSSTGVNQYAPGTSVHSIQLFAVQPRLAGIAKLVALYYLLPR